MVEEHDMDAKHFDHEHQGCRENFVKSLAATIYHRLPREIRNYIYSYCVQSDYDDEVIVRRRTDSRGAIAMLVRESLGPYSYRWMEDPITCLIKVPVLGDDVAREMLESYYRTRKFKIAHRDLPLLETFLRTDTFHMGISPRLYIRRLEIEIGVEDCHVQRLELARSSDEGVGLQAIQALDANVTVCTDVAIALCHGGQPLCRGVRRLGATIFDDAVSATLLRAIASLRTKKPRARIVYRKTWKD